MLRRSTIIAVILALLMGSVQGQQAPTDSWQQWTLEQKVGQMFVMSFFGSELNLAARDFLTTYQPGAVVLLPSNLDNPAQITRLTNDIQQSLIDAGSIPALIAVDQEGGIIAHLEDGFTRWPVPSLLTATQNPDLAVQFGAALATEMRAVGINMNLAPVADLYTNLNNPVIGRRSFGHDPALISPIIASVIEGMQQNNVLATVKHFPGHGDTDQDSHLELPTLQLTVDQLQQRELIPFQAAIEAETGAVMVAHLQFPQIDPDAVTPSSFSEVIIQGILRDDLGYEGLVITDALDMDAIDTVYSPAESALRAIEAGNDLILLGAHISPDNQATAINAVVAAVREGTITQSRINQSVQRIITAKQRFDVLNWIQLEPNQAQLRINREAHAQLVDAMFEQGITQVHDDGNLFPLSGTTLMIYPATRGILGLACNRNDWQFVAVSRNPAAAEIDAAIRAAQFVDNIIVFTENVTANPAQQTLVGRLPSAKTAVVALWSPFDNLALSDVASYFVTYSPLSQSYMPICDILHGDAPALGTASLMLEAE